MSKSKGLILSSKITSTEKIEFLPISYRAYNLLYIYTILVNIIYFNCYAQVWDSVKVLIELGADVNLRCFKNQTALHEAVKKELLWHMPKIQK